MYRPTGEFIIEVNSSFVPIRVIGIVFNPVTFSGKSVDRMKHVLEILDSKGIEYIYRETAKEGDAVSISRELADSCGIIVYAGGDGTVLETVNGVYDRDVTIMVLPFGSGNDIGRSIGIEGMTDEQLADVLTAGKTRTMDYLITNGKERSVVHSCVGIVSNVIRDFKDPANARKSYMSTMLRSVRQSRPRRYRIRTANVDREFYSDFVSAENLVTSGGGMVLTPHSDDDDGKFELLVMEHRNVFRKYLNLLALSRKKLAKQPNVYLESTDRVEITALDGEEICSLDGELRTITELNVSIGGKIRVICP